MVPKASQPWEGVFAIVSRFNTGRDDSRDELALTSQCGIIAASLLACR